MEEVLDIIDLDDHVIGQAPRSEVLAKHLMKRIVHVFAFDDQGRLALQLRSPSVSFLPHHWVTSASGHVRSGETYEQAAMRESEEELGITPLLEVLGKDLYDSGTFQAYLMSYRCSTNGPFTPKTGDVERIEFLPIPVVWSMVLQGEKFHPEFLFLLERYFPKADAT